MTTYTATITEINVEDWRTGKFFDTVVISKDGVEVDSTEVESSEDAEPYDEAVREIVGSDDFAWV